MLVQESCLVCSSVQSLMLHSTTSKLLVSRADDTLIYHLNRPAAYLGLISAVFAAGCLGLFIYLHVRQEVQQSQPHIPVLCVFGVKGAIGISLGVGAFVVFMGLGIIDSINHKGMLVLTVCHYLPLLPVTCYFVQTYRCLAHTT